MMVPFDPSLPDERDCRGRARGERLRPGPDVARRRRATSRSACASATPDGKMTRAGGKVVKNVAGYDLCKLYIGSLGTLCVITEATFKTVPLPKSGS